MFEFLSETIRNDYINSKKLKTNTHLYGYMEEGRWHTHLQPPLSNETIIQFEQQSGRKFPSEYRELLTFHNGCYLFNLLRLAGKEPATYKGLSIEEEDYSAFDLNTMDRLYRNKRTPTNHFIFADSLFKHAYYVIDGDVKILEIDVKTKKVIQTYTDLKTFLKEILMEGNNHLTNDIYVEFE
ncbi:SMI1/KNR4 family protein [Fictibacillus nanhaiensis]|uniref:SMI1/KNR4 family protein n=1 Tax=Fictibacillus nanhaiensis TaxID=742169 RepID=UPI003C21D271